MRTAAHFGAIVANGARADELINEQGRVCGAMIEADERRFKVRAQVVVNATGVWADQVDRLADPQHQKRVRPAKGVHIVVPWSRLPIDGTITVPVTGRSRRASCTRWGDVVLIGLTDTDYDGSFEDVHCTREEMQFLLDGVNSGFTANLSPDDVMGSIGGLRPLVGEKEGATLNMSRDHKITVDDTQMVTVTGGKLTTSRHMGELVTDAVLKILDRKAKCRTVSLPLLGGAGYDSEASSATGGLAAHLGERYGTEARFVSALIAEDPTLGEPIVTGTVYTKAEVVYAARSEMARSVDDVLSRRTRMRLFARDLSLEAAPIVGALLQKELGLTDSAIKQQIADYHESINHEKSILLEDAR